MGRLAIIAGGGVLPAALKVAQPDAFVAAFDGAPCDLPPDAIFAFEHLGALWAALQEAGCDKVCFAGAMRRPSLDPARFDAGMMQLAPQLMAAMGQGDDALLRVVLSGFAAQGFAIVAAHEAAPELLAPAGVFAGPKLPEGAHDDIARAQAILHTMAPLDLGQACVVENGLCLGIETLQGTDFLLQSVAQTPSALRHGGGLLMKMPKIGQDLRVDMPAIGPQTIAGMVRANLRVLAVAAGQTLLLDRPALLRAADDAGITIFGASG